MRLKTRCEQLIKSSQESLDKIENLGWMLKRFKPIKGDNIIHQVHKQMSRELDRLYKHLNKTYKNWD